MKYFGRRVSLSFLLCALAIFAVKEKHRKLVFPCPLGLPGCQHSEGPRAGAEGRALELVCQGVMLSGRN